MSGTQDLNQTVERNIQLQDGNSTLQAPALQNEERPTQGAESELQTRLKATTQQLKKELQDLRAQLARNNESGRNINNEHEKPLKRAMEKLFREIRTLRAQLISKDEDNKAEILKVKRECDALRRDLEAAEERLEQREGYYRDQVTSLEIIGKKQKVEVDRLTGLYAYQKGQLKAKQNEIVRLNEENSALQKRLNAKNLRLNEVNAKENDIQAVLKADEEMAHEIALLKGENAGQYLQLKSKDLWLKKANADKDQLYAALDDASLQAETDVTAMVGLQLLLTEEQTKRRELQKQVHHLMLRIEELTGERDRAVSASFWGKVKKDLGL